MMATKIIDNLFVGDSYDAQSMYSDFFVICVLEIRPVDEPLGAAWIPFLKGDAQEVYADKTQLQNIATLIDLNLTQHRKVLVHCGGGMERSPLAIAWYLHTYKQMSLDDAYALIKTKRPSVRNRCDWLGVETTTIDNSLVADSDVVYHAAEGHKENNS